MTTIDTTQDDFFNFYIFGEFYMALISAKKIKDKEKIKLEIDKEIYSEIDKYCEWAGITNIDHFFEEAAIYIFSKDKDWNKYLKASKKEIV